MQQMTVPPVASVDDLRNVPQIVTERAESHPDAVAFSVHRGKEIVPVTCADFVAEVRAVAKGLIAHGLQVGDHVAVMSATRYEWTLVDFAVLFAGGVVVPIYETNTADQAAFVLSDSDTKAIFIENARHAKVISEACASAGLELSGTWRLQGNDDLTELKAKGESISDEELDQRAASASPETIASLVYTSGTVADPRGAAITHANLAHLTRQIIPMLDDVLFEGASTVLLLPLAHILARFVQLAAFVSGCRMTHVRDASRVIQLLSDAQPTMMVVVPRVMAKVLEGVRKNAAAKKMGKVFARAEKVAVAWGQYREALQEGQVTRPPLALKAEYTLFDKLFYSKIRATMGGNLGTLVSGAAPLDTHLGYFFRGIGIDVLEGYGLTETTAPIAVNIPRAARIGSVGQPVPGSTIKIGPDGEILVKGIGVFAGYHNDAGRDFDAEGYFNTGDLGELDAKGRLSITGRAKDLVITDSGKNIAPQKWQGLVERDLLVGHAVVVGDKRPHAAALVMLDPMPFKEWAEANGKTDLAILAENPPATPGERITDEAVIAHVTKLVDDANKQVSNAERIKDFAVVLADVSEDSGLVTPTMKLKRGLLIQQMAPVVDALYA